MHRRVHRLETAQQPFHAAEVQHIGPVRQRLLGPRVGLDEHPVRPRRHRRKAQRGNELGPPPGHPGSLVGLLQAVRDVRNGRRKRSHGRKTAHVHHQVLVAEHRSPLRQPHPFIAPFPHLVHGEAHGFWGDELAFLDVHHLARVRSRVQQVGLAAQEGGNLQDVHVSRCQCRLRGRMDVGDDGHPEPGAHLGQDLQRLLVPDAPEAVPARAVCLAVRPFENEGQVQPATDVHQGFRNFHRAFTAFDGTGAGDDLELVPGGPDGLGKGVHGAKFGKNGVSCTAWLGPGENPVRSEASRPG